MATTRIQRLHVPLALLVVRHVLVLVVLLVLHAVQAITYQATTASYALPVAPLAVQTIHVLLATLDIS